jgi:hypothetical protein
MHIPGADLDHEEEVQAPQVAAQVHVEEVGRKHRRGLRTQEILPRRVGAPLGRRRDLQRLEDPPDRRCTNPVADVEQLLLPTLIYGKIVDLRGPTRVSSDLRPRVV